VPGKQGYFKQDQQHDTDHAECPGLRVACDNQAFLPRAVGKGCVACVNQPVQMQEASQEGQRCDKQHGDDKCGERRVLQPAVHERQQPTEGEPDYRIPRDRRAVFLRTRCAPQMYWQSSQECPRDEQGHSSFPLKE